MNFLTQAHAEDAALGATAEFEKWKEMFEGNWVAPVRETAMRVMWAQLPAAAKAILQVQMPEQFKIVDEWLR